MKKLLLFITLALTIQLSHGQDTEKEIESFRIRFDNLAVLLQEGNNQGVLDEISSMKNDLVKFEAFNQAAVSSVEMDLEETQKQLSGEISKLKKQIQELEDKLDVATNGLQKEALAFVERILKNKEEQEAAIEELENDLKEAQEDQKELQTENTAFQVDITKLSSDTASLGKQIRSFKTELKKYRSAVQIGLSLGFNAYRNNQRDYVVQADSTIKQIGNGKGASGIISGVVSIRLSDIEKPTRHNLVINVPLGDFTDNSDGAMGIFNNRMAVGLGYSVSPFPEVPYLSFTGIFNMSPYEKIDYDALRGRKFDLQEFTKLNPEDFGATSDISYSFTIGVVYSFINTKSQN